MNARNHLWGHFEDDASFETKRHQTLQICEKAKKRMSCQKSAVLYFYQLVLPNLHSCLEPFNSTCSREAG